MRRKMTVNKSIQPNLLLKKTILIAEDEYMNFELLSEILDGFNVNLIHAANGKIAVEIFKNTPIDLILMDIKMPEMNGVTATKLIKQINNKIPIVALTAHNDTKTNILIKQFFDTVIFKPIDIELTLKTINSLLND